MEVGEDAEEGDEQDDPAVFFRWFRPEGNPFGILLLDMRPLTRTMVAFAKEPTFGRRAAYATFENILLMEINPDCQPPDVEASP